MGLVPGPVRPASRPCAQFKALLGLLGLGFVIHPPPFSAEVVWRTWITGLTDTRAWEGRCDRAAAAAAARASAVPLPAAATLGRVWGREEAATDAVAASDSRGDLVASSQHSLE